MDNHCWKIARCRRYADKDKYYCYWSDSKNRKYSTWYYEPFESEEKARKWIRDINFKRIEFKTHSITRTKY